MKKNYIVPDIKVRNVVLQNMIAVSIPLNAGEGEGKADLAKEDFFDESLLDDFDIGANEWDFGADAW